MIPEEWKGGEHFLLYIKKGDFGAGFGCSWSGLCKSLISWVVGVVYWVGFVISTPVILNGGYIYEKRQLSTGQSPFLGVFRHSKKHY